MTLKDIQKAYRDGSGSVIGLIYSASSDASITKMSLVSALDALIDESLPRARRFCALGDATDTEQKNAVVITGKVIAAEMIILLETRSLRALSRRALEFLELASATVRSSYDFAGKAIDALSRPFTSLGYSWKCLQDAVSLDIIAYHLCSRSKMSGAEFEEGFRCAGKGCVSISGGVLTVVPFRTPSQSAPAFTAAGGRIEVLSRAVRDERLKASEAESASALGAFARAFTAAQNDRQPVAGFRPDIKVEPGARVTIKCLGDGTIEGEDGEVMLCEVLGTRETVTGYIRNEELLKGIWTRDITPYFYSQDCIRDAVVVEDGNVPVFSIRDAYSAFCVAKAREDNRRGITFRAMVTTVREDIDRVNWITAGGYGAISYRDGTEKPGEVRVMQMMNVQGGSARGYYINIGSPKYDYDTVEDFDEESVLLGFVIPLQEAWKEIEAPKEPEKTTQESLESARILSRILARSVSADRSVEALRKLLCAQFVAQVAEDTEDAAYAHSRASYLRCCVSFAQDGTPGTPDRDAVYTEEESKALDALAFHDRPSCIAELSAIAATGLDTPGGGIAALLLAGGISSAFKDEVKAEPDAVRRKICEILGVADEFEGGAVRHGGKYGSAEGSRLEFKASYVFRNDSRTPVPDLVYQGRGQVLEAVCGMLNCEGGTVYIGVDDKSGDPIVSEGYGLDADLRWLCANYDTIDRERLRQLGHHVPFPDDLDHYALFLNAEKELYFKKSLLDLIRIEPTPDRDAIMITVSPSQYELAVLYDDETHSTGQAFVRDGNRTIWMDRTAKERRLMELKKVSRQMGFILTIQEAIDRKHKLVFRDYASGNSGKVRDRFVVPVNLFYNDENVYCWDLEAKAFKQFRLARIGGIENVEDNAYPHAFEPREADVFRWIGDESYHVKAELTVYAHNYLLEEYSNAVNLPEDELYETEDGKWILDTHLHGIGALLRFWFGLADKMTLLPTEDSERIEADFRQYARANFGKYFED